MDGQDADVDHGFIYRKDVPEGKRISLLEKENDVAGFYITGHPLDAYSKDIRREKGLLQIGTLVQELEDAEPDERRYVKVAGIVKEVKVRYTKKNQPFWTFILEDDTGSIKSTWFGGAKNKIEHPEDVFVSSNALIVSGAVSNSAKYGIGLEVFWCKECLQD